MERKSIESYVMADVWECNLMVGDEIKGCVTGEVHPDAESKLDFCRGIFCTFPHMMLTRFTGWMWPEGAPKDFQPFMDKSLPALQEKVFPELEDYFKGGLPVAEQAQLMAVLLTQVIPQQVLGGYYEYMYAGSQEKKDLGTFWPEVQPLLEAIAEMTRNSYVLSPEARAEVFRYLGTQYPFLLLKRWYDWQYGKDVLVMGPPPGAEGGPDSPGPGGPGPGPGGPPPQ